ncbi:cytochrome P450 [Mycena capillaripes]|nr:cytochrome P450 [Mycena capillaripes]
MLLLVALVALCAATALLLMKVGAREDGLPLVHPLFTEWARKYGGLYSLKIGMGTVVVLTDVAAVRELMDRRSVMTADRPPLELNIRMAGGLYLPLSRSNHTWKTMRRTAATILTSQATIEHLPIQRAEATQLLHALIHSPQASRFFHLSQSSSLLAYTLLLTQLTIQSFYTDIQRYSFSVIRSVLYGKRAPRFEAPDVTTFFRVVEEWNALGAPGAMPPVDLFPLLKLVPERWAGWKRECKRIRKLQRVQYFGLLEETKERLLSGEKNGSYMEKVLTRKGELGMDNEMTAYFGSALLEAGAETTSSYLQFLILVLIAHPEVQRKAHEEIDRVVGEDRMPTLDDLEHMPYIRAIILETHRFRPVTPLALPHATTAAQEYQGYMIPKGATIFVNVWGIFHDPALYDNPDDFIPERYLLAENGTKPGVDGSDLRHTFIFGFGRRMCPGIHLAQNSINLNAVNFLWAFNFKPDIDADGNSVPPDTWAYNKGVTTSPLPFQCRITPRTPEKASIIEREFLEAADTFSKFEQALSSEDKDFLAKSRTFGG